VSGKQKDGDRPASYLGSRLVGNSGPCSGGDDTNGLGNRDDPADRSIGLSECLKPRLDRTAASTSKAAPTPQHANTMATINRASAEWLKFLFLSEVIKVSFA
jgi:hypothetical protein